MIELGADPKKLKAVQALQGKAIEKADPNFVPSKKRKAEEIDTARKRVASVVEGAATLSPPKSSRSTSEVARVSSSGEVLSKERLELIRKGRSRNENLVDVFENDEQDRKFDDLEKKEAMEAKMLATTELETKAITCKTCNYTALSQSDLCKQAGHHIRVIRTKKRFFECKQCRRRTMCLDRYPSSACSNCSCTNWVRAGMIREKKGPKLDSEHLLVRGAEQKFVNRTVSSGDVRLDSIAD